MTNGTDKKSNYAAVRDFVDWIASKRGLLSALCEDRHPDIRDEREAKMFFDPTLGLELATEIRRHGEMLEQHFVPQVQEQYRRVALAKARDLKRPSEALANADAEIPRDE